MTITLHHGDLPSEVNLGNIIAVDTEAMGLNNLRDRLCLVQLSSGDGTAHLVQLKAGEYDAPNLKKLLGDRSVSKIFHYARFDVAIIKHYLGVTCEPLYCTKTASRLCRTYTDKHSLRALCSILLNTDLGKQQQTSDWGAEILTKDQQTYAASDVLYLHDLKEKLDVMLKREGRSEMAQAIMDFIPVRADLDLAGWIETDIFAH